MIRVSFTRNLQRHVSCPTVEVSGETLREILEAVFAQNDRARGYILDDRGALRRHMAIFVDGEAILDRSTLSDRVHDGATVHIAQALSGG